MAETLRILHLEDSPRDAELIQSRLVEDGLDVRAVTVANRLDFERAVKGCDFDLVLCDYGLPGFDGLSALEIVRASLPEVPVIFVSGVIGEERAIEVLKSGATDYVLKNNLLRLASAVRRARHDVEERAKRRQAEEAYRLQTEQYSARLEQALRQSTELLHMAERSARLGGYDLNVQTGEVRVSPEFLALYGIAPGTFDGQRETWMSYIHPEDRPLVTSRTAQVYAERLAGFDVEFRILRTDQQVRWMECRAQITYDEQGQPLHHIGVNLDITARKHTEQALKDADRRKDEFLAMLGHELRNPLAPILNAVHLLRRLGPPQPALQRAREMIERQVNQLARLVDDLLDVSRITRGKIQVKREPVNLTEIITSCVQDYAPVIESSGLKPLHCLPDQAVWVHGDAARLQQAFTNLLSNAIKFTDVGGKVSVSLGIEQSKWASIMVCDTGIGLEPEAIGHIFQTFSQVGRSIDRSRGGLGLGLALVKGLVELHGGEASAESPGLGKGATFKIRIPLMAQASPQPATVTPEREHHPRAQRVLIIEDNKDAAESLGLILELAGHKVAIANSGTEGLQRARGFKPNVVLCDIGLPGMDGYAVAKEIRRDQELSQAYLVAMTGYGQEEDRRRAHEAGFDQHITKPAEPRVIEQLLAR